MFHGSQESGHCHSGDAPEICVRSVGTRRKWPVLFAGIREGLLGKGHRAEPWTAR